MVRCANGSEECKAFKVVGSGIGFEGGRYLAKTFSQAAKRAGSKLFARAAASSEYKNKTSIKFILADVTRGGDKKTKAFEVKRITLSTPRKVMLKGVEVVYKYTYDVKVLAAIPSEL